MSYLCLICVLFVSCLCLCCLCRHSCLVFLTSSWCLSCDVMCCLAIVCTGFCSLSTFIGLHSSSSASACEHSPYTRRAVFAICIGSTAYSVVALSCCFRTLTRVHPIMLSLLLFSSVHSRVTVFCDMDWRLRTQRHYIIVLFQDTYPCTSDETRKPVFLMFPFLLSLLAVFTTHWLGFSSKAPLSHLTL